MNRIKLFIFFIFLLLISSITLFSSNKREYQLNNQMIVNGQFEEGDTGFYTDYLYSPRNMRMEGTYCLSQNPQKQYSRFDSCFDKTNQSGFMLLINGSDKADKIVWKQTVRGLDLNSVYKFSFWSASVYPLNPPFFDVYINGVQMQPSPFYISEDVCKWTEIKYIWNSNNIDTAEIVIYDRNIRKSGNDFVIDDISFTIYCSLTASAEKLVSACKGEEVRLQVTTSGGEAPFIYEWFPKTGLDNPYSSNPVARVDQNTTYIVKILDNKFCEAYDTVRVNIFPTPKSVITSAKGFYICPCDSIKLSGPPGMSYLWSTGETTQSIYINKTGTFSLRVIDQNGCVADTSVFVEMLNVSSTIELGTVEAEIGETFVLPVSVKWSDTRVLCNFKINSFSLSYNKSILQPVGIFSNRRVEGDKEIIEIVGNDSEEILNKVKFTATLGKLECSPIEITQLLYDCEEIKVSAFNGQVCLKNLCKEGGTRAVNTDARLFLTVNSYNYLSNELSINIGNIERGSAKLIIYDYLGRQKLIYDIIDLKPGEFEYKFNISQLNAGLYHLVLITNSDILSKPLMISK